jgi:hypothetical protein
MYHEQHLKIVVAVGDVPVIVEEGLLPELGVTHGSLLP